MTIRVLLFASLAEAAAAREVRIEVPEKTSVLEAVRAAADRVPSLARPLAGVATAVNGKLVRPDHVLADGDDLALLPPVSGG